MKEFGSRFGLAESTISGYENGTRKPDLETLSSFADFYEVTVDFILGRTDSPAFTKAELDFMADIDLPLEELKKKYNLTVGGKTTTDEELIGMITWVKTHRMITEEKNKD